MDENNNKLGESKTAAKKAITQVVISRVIMAMPGMSECLLYILHNTSFIFKIIGHQSRDVHFIFIIRGHSSL